MSTYPESDVGIPATARGEGGSGTREAPEVSLRTRGGEAASASNCQRASEVAELGWRSNFEYWDLLKMCDVALAVWGWRGRMMVRSLRLVTMNSANNPEPDCTRVHSAEDVRIVRIEHHHTWTGQRHRATRQPQWQCHIAEIIGASFV